MLFKLSNRHEQFEIYYDETSLEIVKIFIYLGVDVSSNGKFYQAQKHLSEQTLPGDYRVTDEALLAETT